MDFSICTSYFYQIRNFKPWMIPVSTALSDPAWYMPPKDQEWYYDKRGIVCGLRYEPLIVQRYAKLECMGSLTACGFAQSRDTNYQCEVMLEYRQLLENKVDFDRTIKAFQYCVDKFHRPFDNKEPIIVLIVYESPSNLCSERWALQDYFTSHGQNCKELEYPIL